MNESSKHKFRSKKDKKNSKSSKLLPIFSFIVLIFSIITFSFFFFFWLDAPSTDIPETGVIFNIENGEFGSSIANRLEMLGLIKSGYLFRLILKLNFFNNEIKTGTYLIKPGMKTTSIISLLTSGKEMLSKVTIPEGSTLTKIALILEKAGITTAELFMAEAKSSETLAELEINCNSVEGYLFPDSYYFALNTPPKKILQTIVSKYKSVLKNEFPESEYLNGEELKERLIMASIVEREYYLEKEAPMIAGVFYNRLGINMNLRSCATVVYIITEILGKKHPNRLFFDDLEINNPYNTYVYSGLPPGPICNPGLIALKAAFRPDSVPYLFFRLVNPSEGKHYFSETFEEHNQALSLNIKDIQD